MSATAGGGSTQTDGPAPVQRTGWASSPAWSSRSWAGTTTPTTSSGSPSRTRIDADMVDGDYGNVVDAVLLWWRDEDGDLVDGLVDSLTDLVGGGAIWLLTPKVGRPERRRRRRHRRGRADRRALPDHHRRGEQGLVRHPAGRPQDARLTRPTGAAKLGSPVIRDRPRPGRGRRHQPEGADRGRDHPALLAAGARRHRAGAADWGTGPAGGFTALAVRAPHQVGLVDELGSLTFGEMHRRSNAWPAAWPSGGSARATRVAVMCRNHRGFVDATVAVAKLGADLLYLNTAFAGPQLVDVLEREEPAVVIHDEEFTEPARRGRGRAPDRGLGRRRGRRATPSSR